LNVVTRLLAVVLFLCACINTAQSIEVTATDQKINPLATLEFIEDKQSSLTLDDVSDASSASAFKKVQITGKDINLGFSTASFWFRIPLQRTVNAPPSWFFEIAFFYLDHIEFYAPGKPPVITGSTYPFSSRPVFNRFYVFPLDLNTEPQYFYFKVRTSGTLILPVTIWQPQAFSIASQKSYFILTLYYGGLWVLVIYNLLLFISLRDKNYLYYSLYALNISMGSLVRAGLGKQFIWPDLIAWDQIARHVYYSMAGVFVILFSQGYLKTQRYMPKTHNFLTIVGAIYILITLLLTIPLSSPIPTSILSQIIMVISITVGITLIYTPIKLLFLGHKGTGLFLLGWSILWFGVIIASLRDFGLIPTNAYSADAFRIATGLEMLIFAFALANRVHTEKQLKEKAQHETLEIKQALIDTLTHSEQNLENQVKLRTEQLEASLSNEKQLLDQYIRFGALISHEFRNQFGIIQSQLSLLIKEYEMGINKLDSRLPIIKDTTHGLMSLFEKWLQNGRFNKGLNDVNRQHFALGTWLTGIVDSYVKLQQQHRFELRLSPTIDTLLADKSLLTLVIQNLLDNACKYSGSSELIVIETRSKIGMTGIAVIDQGVGIALEHHDMIFSDYYRVNPETTIQGMGLGLSLVQRIIQLHGGTVELNSSPGSGSCFCIWLKNT
jgi:signal transduction histidine kinase